MAKDIISTLSDDILCHILSFLQIKEAGATTILSKRWKHLWRSVTTLHIDYMDVDQTLNSHSALINFVNSVLFFRHPASPIKTFHLEVALLTYDDDDDDDDGDFLESADKNINQWLNFVVSRGVEYLFLRVLLGYFPKFPITIFTCKTLVVLKLSSFKVEKGFDDILLPSLKTCYLEYVMFPKFRDFIMFLIGCPILQYLCTYHVDFDPDESFTCNDWKSILSSNLTEADIDCCHCYFPVKVVRNVPSLRFWYRQKYYHNDLIPTFHNLTQLELYCYDYSKELLLDVLNHCPKLQRLDLDEDKYLDKEVCARKNDKTNWIFPDAVPQCLLLHLRTFNLFRFSGLHAELMLARYILKSAKVLQTMNIWNMGKPAIKKRLFKFPKASSTCKLTVYHDPDGLRRFPSIATGGLQF